LQQEEDNENHNDTGRSERLKQRCGDLLQEQQRRRIGLVDLYWHRVLRLVVARETGGLIYYAARSLLLRLLDLLAEITQHRRGTVDNTATSCRVSKGVDLFGDVGLISGQFSGQMRKLVADEEADTGDHYEGQSDHDYYRGHTAEVPTAQHQNRWSERKTQENRERRRNKYFPAEIERSNDNNTDRQGPETRRRNTGWANLDPVKAGCGVRHRRAARRRRCGH
jgi:hypothetical protein